MRKHGKSHPHSLRKLWWAYLRGVMNGSHRHKHAHTHIGGHFHPINSEWAQSRIENNPLYQSKAGLGNSWNDSTRSPPPLPLPFNAWLLTRPQFHFSSPNFPPLALVLNCWILWTAAVVITETALVLEVSENKLAMGRANLIWVLIGLMVDP